jgi:tetratricopeptide (TPR) repeat protein
VRAVDAAIAALLEAFEPRADLTVLTADHGESLGEHREGTHGYFVYDATLLVPLVFRFQGVVPTGRSDLPARLVDVMPTILDLAGLGQGLPADLDGVSLVPLLAGQELALPPALVETYQPWISYGWAPLTGLRTDSWKLIVAPRPELYDLRRDPREAVDLYASERPTASELARELRRLQARPVASSSGLEDPEALATLRALGYLGTASPGLEPTGDLPDPKDRLAERDLLATGESLLRQGSFSGALELFGRVLEREPGNRFATLRSGIALLKANEPARAVPFLRRAAELDPAQAETRFALADALTRTGRLDEAAEQWLETVRLQPRRVAAWANLGTVLAQSGKLEEAVKALREAVELDPADGRLRSNLAFALRGAGRTAEALEALLEAERVAVEGTFPYAPTLGLLLLEGGRPAEALPRLETAVPGTLDYAAARVALARLYLEQGRRQDAEAALRAALDADPSLAESLREDPLLGPLLERPQG